MSNAPWTSDQIRALCLEHGFARAGVAPAQRSPRAEVLEDWIAAGYGTMGMADVDVRSARGGCSTEPSRSSACSTATRTVRGRTRIRVGQGGGTHAAATTTWS